jgi:hypothetical protein
MQIFAGTEDFNIPAAGSILAVHQGFSEPRQIVRESATENRAVSGTVSLILITSTTDFFARLKRSLNFSGNT